MNTKPQKQVPHQTIIKRIELLTRVELVTTWILFIVQEYLFHSWVFFFSALAHLLLNILEIHVLGYSKQIISKNMLIICIITFLTVTLVTVLVYGFQYIIMLLFLQLPILLLKMRIRVFVTNGHIQIQDQQHLQLETSHHQ